MSEATPIALTSDVLAHLLLGDDSMLLARAKTVLAQAEEFTATPGCFQELVDILEANECAPTEIQVALTRLLALPNFRPMQAEALRQALVWYGQGMAFPDALQLALYPELRVLTFDRRFIRQVEKLALAVNVREVPR